MIIFLPVQQQGAELVKYYSLVWRSLKYRHLKIKIKSTYTPRPIDHPGKMFGISRGYAVTLQVKRSKLYLVSSSRE